MVSAIFIFKYKYMYIEAMTRQKILVKKMDMDKVVAEVAKQLSSTPNKGWWARLLDKNNDEVSSSSFFICVLLFVGVLLLLVPLFALSIEAWFNHTITTDLTGMAAYIGAVTAIFSVAAGLKGWVSHNDAKTKVAELNNDMCTEEIID